jgi:hypothetical protein
VRASFANAKGLRHKIAQAFYPKPDQLANVMVTLVSP